MPLQEFKPQVTKAGVQVWIRRQGLSLQQWEAETPQADVYDSSPGGHRAGWHTWCVPGTEGLEKDTHGGPFPLSSSGALSTPWLHMPKTLVCSPRCQWGHKLGACSRGPPPAPSQSPKPRRAQGSLLSASAGAEGPGWKSGLCSQDPGGEGSGLRCPPAPLVTPRHDGGQWQTVAVGVGRRLRFQGHFEGGTSRSLWQVSWRNRLRGEAGVAGSWAEQPGGWRKVQEGRFGGESFLFRGPELDSCGRDGGREAGHWCLEVRGHHETGETTPGAPRCGGRM